MDYTLLTQTHYFSLYFVKKHPSYCNEYNEKYKNRTSSFVYHSFYFYVSLFFASSCKQPANRNFYDL